MLTGSVPAFGMDSALLAQLVLLVLGIACTVAAALFARRAASFDLIRDFDALCVAVDRMQREQRSVKMARVRAAAAPEPAQPGLASFDPHQPLTKDQLRAIARQRAAGGKPQ